MKNIGMIGLGNIAHRVAKGILASKSANLYAVASRDKEKSLAFAQMYGAEKACEGYEELLEDAQVDMVYICTPSAFHFD